MTELLEMNPRTVDTELDEPEIEFAEAWDAKTQDRGRCIVSYFHGTRIC